jgi:hypothetical protein
LEVLPESKNVKEWKSIRVKEFGQFLSGDGSAVTTPICARIVFAQSESRDCLAAVRPPPFIEKAGKEIPAAEARPKRGCRSLVSVGPSITINIT